MEPISFIKGHGTENDFVVLPDPDGRLDLESGELVRALCHRRRGIGADGVLRAVRCGAVSSIPNLDESLWFMDYRNADGSLGEMCGNGLRVFGRYLVEVGLVKAGTHRIATRAGVRTVTVGTIDEDVTADMGPARVWGSSSTLIGDLVLHGVAVDVGNPHLACVTTTPPAAWSLATRPKVDPVLFSAGVNVEVLSPLRGGAVWLQVYERGSGETRSCGTGTVAGAVAALHDAGRDTGTVTVETPGGALVVTVSGHTTTLRGPAELTARGTFGLRWPNAR